jgi:hypothetical protein
VLSVFRETLDGLRRDPEYAALLADDLVFVDPAVYTAVQCYRSLRADGLLNAKGLDIPRVKSFMSVGRDGPLPMDVKYGRNVGQKDIGTKIVPMDEKTMSADAVKRLVELLPVSSREIFRK